MSDEALRDIARRAGIAVEWQDHANRTKVVAPEVLRQVLAALRLPADTSRELAASRRAVSRRAGLSELPPLITAIAGRPTRLDIGGNEAQPAQLILERGGTRDISLLPARGRLRVPAVAEIGYHRMRVEDREVVLAVAPARCRTIEDVVPDARLWGLSAQTYALRSSEDLGVGDAACVADLAEAAGQRGADALSLSPLHALYAADAGRIDPFMPSSHLFLNPLYAAPGLVFDRDRVAQAMNDAGARAGVANDQTLIDWPAAAATKLAVLRALFDLFLDGPEMDGPLGADFARFRAEQGVHLAEHACFETLHAAQMPDGDWRRWPTDLRDPRSAAIAAFAGAHRRDMLFHSFLQWLADRSFITAQIKARQAGMRIGLISDLALGVDPAGSLAWSRQDEMLLGLSVGAPPDPRHAQGRNWGMTCFSPRSLVDTGFAPFIAMLRAALRQVGGVRVDQVSCLSQVWVVPDGASPEDGAYLTYPMADLLRLMALESTRQDGVIIGNRLDHAPEGFRDSLEQAGVHSTQVLWWERDGQGGFATPRNWDRSAVAMPSEPDLPTVAGWWGGTDIAARAENHVLGNGEDRTAAEHERAEDRPALWRAFTTEQLVSGQPPSSDLTEPVVDAALLFVARTESPLCLLPVDDLLGQVEQPVLPGSANGYPSWRRRLPVDAADTLDHGSAARRVAAVAAERPRQ